MKKKLLILILSIAGISAGYSQIVTPFTSATRDENGKRVYVKPQEVYRRFSLSIGYGYGAVTMMDWYANKNAKSVDAANKPIEGELISRRGTFSFSIGYEITPWLEMEFPFMMALSQGKFLNHRGANNAGYNDYWFTFMPGARINWVRNNWLALYSKANIGVSLHRRDQFFSGSAAANDNGAFAYQLSPAGIEIGKSWFNFFVEGGYGFRGYVYGGLKFKIGSGGSGGGSGQWGRITYPPM